MCVCVCVCDMITKDNPYQYEQSFKVLYNNRYN